MIRAIEVGDVHLRELIGRHARFERFDVRANEWVSTRCPPDVAPTYLARRSLEWRLPELAGIVTAPTLRQDGSVLQAPGYDEQSGLFFDPRGVRFPAISDRPSRAEGVAALGGLTDLLAEFPFEEPADRSAALAMILTALVRRSLTTAPLFAITAPAPGTGKSLLVDVACLIATGAVASAFDWTPDEAENGKRIDAALLAGAPAIVLDNVQTELSGARLNQILTAQQIDVRVLGQSKVVPGVRCDALVLANGNNLVVAADMTRRTVLCRLDANLERPEARQFQGNPLAAVAADRGKYVVAALTVLRAYIAAGQPAVGLSPMGSFERWRGLVCGALVWLGHADPATNAEAIRSADPRRAELIAVTENWARVIGARNISVQEITGDFLDRGLQTALLAVAGAGGSVNPRRLGYWLRANKGKIINGMRFLPDTTHKGALTWRLHGIPAGAQSAEVIEFLSPRPGAVGASDVNSLLA